MPSNFIGARFQAIGRSPLGVVGPLPGAQLFTYTAGTTTPLSTYTATGATNTNPVVCDALGQAHIGLGSAAYHLILKDQFGVTVWDEDNVRAPDVSSADLASGTGASLIATLRPETGAVLRTLQQKSRELVSVMDFGAVGDGVTDDTAAFNRATQSTTPWSPALIYDILVPSGPGIKFKLNGTVYLRKGQTLRGSGNGAYLDMSGNSTTSGIWMGWGLISGAPAQDAGGNPPRVDSLFVIGGAPGHGSIFANCTGFSISNIFMSAVGIGIEINGGDGLIQNIEIDQSLTAVSMTSAQNIAFSNFNLYLPSFGFVFANDCRDIAISNGIIEYAQYAGMITSASNTNVKGVVVSNVNFATNAQYSTLLGHVVTNANAVEMQFAGCSFRNMYNWAINHTTGVGVNLTFSGCVFDGNRTTSLYAQSTTAKGINTGPSGGAGIYNFFGCEFRNLLGEIATINDGCVKLTISGGYVSGCDSTTASQKRFNVVTTLMPSITVKSVAGFPYVFTSGSNKCATLPWWGASTMWEVSIKGNTQAVGDGNYSAFEKSAFTVTWMNVSGTKNILLDKVLIWKTPTRTNPGDLAATACLGTAPGGSATTTTFANSGNMCISVPFTNAGTFDFFAETLT